MKVYSGILIPSAGNRESGNVRINFNRFPREGDELGEARVVHLRRVGGTGNFRNLPAYSVNFREMIFQDKGKGLNELDHWKLNSKCKQDHLFVEWTLNDKKAEVREISFMIIGE